MGEFSENIQVYQNHNEDEFFVQNGYVEIAIHTQLLCTRSLSCEKRSETSWSGNSNSTKTKAGMCKLLAFNVFPKGFRWKLGYAKNGWTEFATHLNSSQRSSAQLRPRGVFYGPCTKGARPYVAIAAERFVVDELFSSTKKE